MLRNSKITRQRVYVETSALTSAFQSGIGHSLLETLRAWGENMSYQASFEVCLLCPYDKRRELSKLKLPFSVQTLPLPDKALRLLRKANLLPPLDLFVGRGIFVFPNYWNCPLLSSPAVTYVYDLSFVTHPDFAAPKNGAFLRRHMGSWLSRSDIIITTSDYSRQTIQRHYNPSQSVAVVRCGVDTRFFAHATSSEIEEAKQRYNIRGKYFLHVGNIEPRKNLSRLIAAYRKLPETIRTEYGLVFIGADGWQNEQFYSELEQAQAEGYNIQKVRTFVRDDELPLLYAGAYALIHPSLEEGFGMTPLEAMATSVPVVVSSVTSLPEVVGEAGLYIDPANTSDISGKIQMLVEDHALYKSLQKKGKERARLYPWSRTVDELERQLATLGQHG